MEQRTRHLTLDDAPERDQLVRQAPEDRVPGMEEHIPLLRLAGQIGMLALAIGCWMLIYRLARLVI